MTKTKLKLDIDELVRESRARGRASFTLSGCLRVNLFYHPCKGWLLVTQVLDLDDPRVQAARKYPKVLSLLAATCVTTELRARGETGSFIAEPCQHGEALAYVWGRADS